MKEVIKFENGKLAFRICHCGMFLLISKHFSMQSHYVEFVQRILLLLY